MAYKNSSISGNTYFDRNTYLYIFVSERRNLFLSEKKELENIEKAKQEKLTNLRNATKQVAARLSAGTSLRDSTISF